MESVPSLAKRCILAIFTLGRRKEVEKREVNCLGSGSTAGPGIQCGLNQKKQKTGMAGGQEGNWGNLGLCGK